MGFHTRCKKTWCSAHRLPEAHFCPELKSCRDAAQTRLTDKLISEKTVRMYISYYNSFQELTEALLLCSTIHIRSDQMAPKINNIA